MEAMTAGILARYALPQYGIGFARYGRFINEEGIMPGVGTFDCVCPCRGDCLERIDASHSSGDFYADSGKPARNTSTCLHNGGSLLHRIHMAHIAGRKGLLRGKCHMDRIRYALAYVILASRHSIRSVMD
jgi:hypothetical protein